MASTAKELPTKPITKDQRIIEKIIKKLEQFTEIETRIVTIKDDKCIFRIYTHERPDTKVIFKILKAGFSDEEIRVLRFENLFFIKALIITFSIR